MSPVQVQSINENVAFLEPECKSVLKLLLTIFRVFLNHCFFRLIEELFAGYGFGIFLLQLAILKLFQKGKIKIAF